MQLRRHPEIRKSFNSGFSFGLKFFSFGPFYFLRPISFSFSSQLSPLCRPILFPFPHAPSPAAPHSFPFLLFFLSSLCLVVPATSASFFLPFLCLCLSPIRLRCCASLQLSLSDAYIRGPNHVLFLAPRSSPKTLSYPYRFCSCCVAIR